MATIENCIVEDVLLRPFSSRTMEDKLFLVNSPIPRPPMDQLKSSYTSKGKMMTRNFNVSSYEKQWLSGSTKLNKLFCWPCLLFRNAADKGSVWSKTGFSDLNHLSAAIKSHSSSKDHINNAFALSTYGQQRIDEALDYGCLVARNRHNAEVTKNRSGMKTLIEVTCLLASHGLAFRGHNERTESANRGNYKDLCSVIAAKDPAFKEFIDSKIFSGTSAGIQNELIECIGEHMLKEIKKEVADADFISIMLDESTDSARLSQLSCALRYVKLDGMGIN